MQEDLQALADLEATSLNIALHPSPLQPDTLVSVHRTDLTDQMSDRTDMNLSDLTDAYLPTDVLAQPGGLEGVHHRDGVGTDLLESEAVSNFSCEDGGDEAHELLDYSDAISDTMTAMTADEVQRFLERYPRQRTILQFRIEKKKALMRCAQILRSE